MNKEKNIKIVDITIKDLQPTIYLVQELANGRTQDLLRLANKGIIQMATTEEVSEMENKVSEEELNDLKNSQTSIYESKLKKLDEKYKSDGYTPEEDGYLKIFEWENQKYVVEGTMKWHVLKDLFGHEYNLKVKEIYE